jgi:hypothetical protein
MAFAATGPFTNPDPNEDESYPNAYFEITQVHLTRGATPNDASAFYSVWKSQAAHGSGKKARFSNTFPFNYVNGAGTIYAQALAALKALPEYPGLVDA